MEFKSNSSSQQKQKKSGLVTDASKMLKKQAFKFHYMNHGESSEISESI